MLYLLTFALWAIIGAQLFQYSAYAPANKWVKFAYYVASGPIIWALWTWDKYKM